MADFGSIDGRSEAPGGGAGRLSASELRPADAAGRDRPETTEEGLMADLDVVEREAREAREEAARLRARVAALEAALTFPTTARCAGHDGSPHPERSTHTVADCVSAGCDCRCSSRAWDAKQRVMHGGTSALDAVVSAAVAARVAAIRARVVSVIERDRGFIGTTAMVPVDSVMAAILDPTSAGDGR